jgi:hypothetical protein
VSLDRMKSIFQKLEKANIKYNIDLLTFIYKDNLEEDMRILKEDLETIKKELNPKRITIFPNYNGLPNIVLHPEKKGEALKKIRRFRQLVMDFADNNGYVNIHIGTTKLDEESIFATKDTHIRNPMLVRKDMANERWKTYTSTDPRYGRNLDYNVLAFGGYGDRKVYSYIKDNLVYHTIHIPDVRIFELLKIDLKYPIK